MAKKKKKKAKMINGDKYWYNEKGIPHRTGGPAIVYANGDTEWYKDGNIHRTDGPAIEFKNGIKMWYINDLRHRIDGPAIVYPTGEEYWFRKGKPVDPIPDCVFLWEKKLSEKSNN